MFRLKIVHLLKSSFVIAATYNTKRYNSIFFLSNRLKSRSMKRFLFVWMFNVCFFVFLYSSCLKHNNLNYKTTRNKIFHSNTSQHWLFHSDTKPSSITHSYFIFEPVLFVFSDSNKCPSCSSKIISVYSASTSWIVESVIKI